MSTFSTFKGAAERFMQARRRRQTMRVIEALPMYLQKDIGWLADEGRSASRKAR